ncbi:MAG TPA: hypothetical protein VE175_14060 [Woeseiaceae bacterium]|jgi:hypothetical protein|nr:hypothetical protein [Woeseiaceae bacterium]
MKRCVTMLLMLPALLLTACTREPATPAADTPEGPAYVTLDRDLTALKADFNRMADKTRLVFLSGPSCGICLRGMDDLNRAIVQSLQDDPRVHTFVVYVPTLGANEKHAAAAVSLMQGPRVSHYWDKEGESGLLFQQTLGIDRYAWDVWMMFDPGARWEPDAAPPAPAFWQHQLPGLPKDQRLNAKTFAATVTAHLAKRPPATAAAAPETSARGEPGLFSVAQPLAVMIRQNHASRGGYDKLKTIAAIRYSGAVTAADEKASLPLTIETARPDRYTRRIGRGADRSIVTWDGAEVVRGGANPFLPPDVEDTILSSYEFDGWMTDWKDKGHRVQRIGMKRYHDRLPWIVEAQLANGRTWHVYVDSHTGDAFRQALIGPNGEETIALELGDYRDEDGFRLPHRIEYYDGDELLATDRYTSVDVELISPAAD